VRITAFSEIEMLHEIPPRASDPNAVIAELEYLLRCVVDDKISLRTNLDPQLGRVAADPTTLRWVLVNVVVNALKAMLARNVVITTSNMELDQGAASDVNVSPGPYIRIEIGVTGSGVDAQPEICNLVQAAHGAVSVRDAEAEGVMVMILLPRMRVEELPDR
jgi:signal transduction histidine kinase